ncbi:MAG: pyrroline-5-carboxylate reductase [Synergistaceae bacterium]|jgi:pyrroline-5-carboxylate reductase|nr:pyrroline-5-carboxylate reductase [Synergistaceae bacterium]
MHNSGAKLSFIGAGNVTEMILSNLSRKGVFSDSKDIMVSDSNHDRCEWMASNFKVKIAAENRTAFEYADIVFICVRPPVIPELISELSKCEKRSATVVTIAGGVSISEIEKIGFDIPIIRTLPNPPSRVGYGILPIACNGNVTPEIKHKVVKILENLGHCIDMNEDEINIVTSLSSSAPVFAFIENMVEAGVLCGLSREKAALIAGHTVAGCMKMREADSASTFGEMTSEACTPGGISAEILMTLDKYAWRAAIKDAYRTGAEKAAKTKTHPGVTTTAPNPSLRC